MDGVRDGRDDACAALGGFAARLQAAGVPVIREVEKQDFGGRMGVWRDPDGVPVSVLSFG